MQIAILGAGNVGTALATSLTKAGHTVIVSSSGSATAQETATGTGATAAPTNRQAVQGAEIVILATPFLALDALAADLGSALDGKVVVDPSNPMKPDMEGPLYEDEGSAAQVIQARFPRARVVKALNTVFATRQADPFVDGVALDGFVAADDDAAKAKVLALLESIGMRPVDAGPLRHARYLEAVGFLNIWLNAVHGWSWSGGWKLLEPTTARVGAA